MSQYGKLTDVYAPTVEAEKSPLSAEDQIRFPEQTVLRRRRRRVFGSCIVLLTLLLIGVAVGILVLLRHNHHRAHSERFEYDAEYETTKHVTEVVEVYDNQTITQTTESLNQVTLYLYEQNIRIVRDEKSCRVMTHKTSFEEDLKKAQELRVQGKILTQTMVYEDIRTITTEELMEFGGEAATLFCEQRSIRYRTKEYSFEFLQVQNKETTQSALPFESTDDHTYEVQQTSPVTESGEVDNIFDNLLPESGDLDLPDESSGDDFGIPNMPSRVFGIPQMPKLRLERDLGDFRLDAEEELQPVLFTAFDMTYYTMACYRRLLASQAIHGDRFNEEGSGDADQLF